MKAGFFCAALGAFAVISTTAAAQEARIDSATPAPAPVAPAVAVARESAVITRAGETAAPVAGRLSSVGVQYRPVSTFNIAAQDSSGGVKDFFFGTQRRKSTTLLVGGAALAGIGVGVVKGHPGAIMGVAGLLSCIAGMYYLF